MWSGGEGCEKEREGGGTYLSSNVLKSPSIKSQIRTPFLVAWKRVEFFVFETKLAWVVFVCLVTQDHTIQRSIDFNLGSIRWANSFLRCADTERKTKRNWQSQHAPCQGQRESTPKSVTSCCLCLLLAIHLPLDENRKLKSTRRNTWRNRQQKSPVLKNSSVELAVIWGAFRSLCFPVPLCFGHYVSQLPCVSLAMCSGCCVFWSLCCTLDIEIEILKRLTFGLYPNYTCWSASVTVCICFIRCDLGNSPISHFPTFVLVCVCVFVGGGGLNQLELPAKRTCIWGIAVNAILLTRLVNRAALKKQNKEETHSPLFCDTVCPVRFAGRTVFLITNVDVAIRFGTHSIIRTRDPWCSLAYRYVPDRKSSIDLSSLPSPSSHFYGSRQTTVPCEWQLHCLENKKATLRKPAVPNFDPTPHSDELALLNWPNWVTDGVGGVTQLAQVS